MSTETSPDFAGDAYEPELLALDARLVREDGLTFNIGRFLIRARRNAGNEAPR